VLRGSWLVFFLALVLVAEGFLVSNLITRQSSTTFLAAVLPAEVITLTNTQRIQNKVGTVTENTVLDAAATAKAQDMAAKGYFSHIGPDGKEPWAWIQGAGYDYQYAGENLAVRFVDSKDVVNAWMASPTHRANMVKASYTQIGVGVAQGMYQGQQATFCLTRNKSARRRNGPKRSRRCPRCVDYHAHIVAVGCGLFAACRGKPTLDYKHYFVHRCRHIAGGAGTDIFCPYTNPACVYVDCRLAGDSFYAFYNCL
jgi:hypothetical protein